MRSTLLFIPVCGSLGGALAFSFTAGNPTQCDSFTVQWSGGISPLVLTLVPALGVPRNVTIQTNGASSGSFTFQMPLPQGQRMLMTMSDATGFATGGTSDVLTVGNSVSGNSCNVTNPWYEFYFVLNSPLATCQQYPITGWNGAVQPVSIYMVVPLGPSMVFYPSFSSSYTAYWTPNIQPGTSVIFMMVDAVGHQGGSSDFQVAQHSSDTSCLASANSTTTTSATTPTRTGGISPSSSASSQDVFSVSIIAGIAACGAVIIALIAGICILKRRNQTRRPITLHPARPYGPLSSFVLLGQLPGRGSYADDAGATLVADPSPGFHAHVEGSPNPLDPYLSPDWFYKTFKNQNAFITTMQHWLPSALWVHAIALHIPDLQLAQFRQSPRNLLTAEQFREFVMSTQNVEFRRALVGWLVENNYQWLVSFS